MCSRRLLLLMLLLFAANAQKRPECQQLQQKMDVDKSNVITVFGRQFYFNDTDSMPWYDTRDWCTERDMQFPSLKTLIEIEAVAAELRNHTIVRDYWLAASDIGWWPGQFHWADGTEVDDSTWFPGGAGYAPQPYNFGTGKETCVWLQTPHAALFDAQCSERSHIFCEIPASLSTCFI